MRNVARRFDVRGSFKARAAITSRYLTIPADAYAHASAYLSGTLAMLNELNNESGEELDAGFDAVQEYVSPRL